MRIQKIIMTATLLLITLIVFGACSKPVDLKPNPFATFARIMMKK